MTITVFSSEEIEKEAKRLHEKLSKAGWTFADCKRIAPLTLRINKLKKEKNAIILAHSYQTADIINGVADFTGDSYGLSKKAQEVDADIIIFAGVRFMAETAKMLNPDKTVILPSPEAGCSLADSITAEDVRRLKEQHPGLPVVTYINTNADVKAESDVVVTSSNAVKILKKVDSDKIIFIPDKLMLENLKAETKKNLIGWHGTCEVHEQFTAEEIEEARKRFKDIVVLAHPECKPEVVEKADFVGSTSQMYEYVKNSPAKVFMVITECGLVERMKIEINAGKKFVGTCIMCPYMKKITLENILQALENPKPEQIIEVDENIRVKALESIQKMFELTAS